MPARCLTPARVPRTSIRNAPATNSAVGICLADSSSIRSSVGASLMWASPVGPIRMDFAHVLTSQSYDQQQFFRFGAATKF